MKKKKNKIKRTREPKHRPVIIFGEDSREDAREKRERKEKK